jgi:hypothetical protein
MVVLIRFLIGLILGAAIVIWGGVPGVPGLFVAVAIAVLTAIWGDDPFVVVDASL